MDQGSEARLHSEAETNIICSVPLQIHRALIPDPLGRSVCYSLYRHQWIRDQQLSRHQSPPVATGVLLISGLGGLMFNRTAIATKPEISLGRTKTVALRTV